MVDDDVNSALSPLCTTVSAQCTHALSLYKGRVVTVQEREREREREREKERSTVDVMAQTLLSLLSVLQ
jgi:hypothetical protein